MCDGDFRMQRNWSLESPCVSPCIVETVASRHIPTFGRTRRFLDIKIETLPPKCKSKSVKQIPPVRSSPTMVEVKDVQVARSFGCPAKKSRPISRPDSSLGRRTRPSHGMRSTRGRTKRGSACLFSSTLYYARAPSIVNALRNRPV